MYGHFVYTMIQYTWNKKKNLSNIKIHGIDFTDAVEMFDLPMLTLIDIRHDYKEERWIGIGFLKNIVAVMVYTEDENKILYV